MPASAKKLARPSPSGEPKLALAASVRWWCPASGGNGRAVVSPARPRDFVVQAEHLPTWSHAATGTFHWRGQAADVDADEVALGSPLTIHSAKARAGAARPEAMPTELNPAATEFPRTFGASAEG